MNCDFLNCNLCINNGEDFKYSNFIKIIFLI